jgi:O-antigen/teichoic acid export membrane protein
MSSTRLTAILRNSVFLGMATVLDRGGEYLLVLYMARALGAEFLGDYILVLALYQIFQKLGTFGLNQLIMRRVARDSSSVTRLLGNYLLVSGSLALCLMAAMYVTANLLAYQGTVLLAMYVAMLALLPGILRGVTEAIISGLQRMEFITLISFTGSLIRVATAIYLLSRGAPLTGVFWMLVLSEMLMTVLYAVTIHRRLARLELRADLAQSAKLIPAVANFFLMSIFLVGANHVDAVILSKLADQRSVGLYGAALKLVQVIILFRPAILQALFPSMSSLFISAPLRFEQLVETSIRFFLSALIPVAMIVTLWAGPIVSLLYGQDFQSAALTLQILIWVILPSYAYGTLTRALVASDNEKLTIIVAAISMGSNIALDLLLIPGLGAAGAALASLVTMSLAALLAGWCVWRYVFAFDFWRAFLRPLLIVGLMSVALYTLLPVSPWIKTFVWLILYLLLLVWTGLLPLQTLDRGRALFRRWLASARDPR